MMTLFDALKVGAGAFLGASVITVYAHTVSLPAAREAGREEVRAETIKRAMELVQERSRTNADVQKLDDRSICIELGGLFEDGACR